MNCLTTLYNHQQRAVEKLLPTRVGALFMEMGTGKTRTAIELVRLRQERIDRVVWFCPVSLKETIRQEIRRHVEGAEICVFDEHTSRKRLPAAFWYIVGIESMSSSSRVVLAARALIDERAYVIVDESSYIKGNFAKRTERITLLAEEARYRLILTGTPISQGVVDLYAQMRFLSPKILGYNSFYSFAHNHLEYSEKYPDMIVRAHHTGHLAAKIQPYVYQVTKAECLDLPEKLYESRWFYLTDEQRAAYYQAKEEILLGTPPEDLSSYVIFQLFTALQQITSGYWHREDKILEFPHHRLDLLDEIIAELPAGEKAIIWCRYRYSVAAIVSRLRAAHGGDCVAEFHGGLDERARAAEIERFRGQAAYLVATQQSGGHGLTLTGAHYAIFYENGFKFSDRIQAEDRCHRIGQDQPVTYIDVISQSGIEERIHQSLEKKSNALRDFKNQVNAVKDKKDKLSKLMEEL